MSDQKEAMLKINDKEYKVSDLSDEAKAQLQSLRFSEAEIQRLKMQLSVTQTAYNAYQNALLTNLPKD